MPTAARSDIYRRRLLTSQSAAVPFTQSKSSRNRIGWPVLLRSLLPAPCIFPRHSSLAPFRLSTPNTHQSRSRQLFHKSWNFLPGNSGDLRSDFEPPRRSTNNHSRARLRILGQESLQMPCVPLGRCIAPFYFHRQPAVFCHHHPIHLGSIGITPKPEPHVFPRLPCRT